ncbi:cytochrome P450 2J4-like [Ruditapes philippinarum]|uniref:cytochrome P450 2J4-like n=1 Tax=Ruditapes philippinarum TaxID=129788 RepID=UPI00295A9FEA|nr:cytochrome P450 2J4-like [Ruditapes philippinarum]
MFEILLGICCSLSLVYVFLCVWRRRKRKLPPGPQGYLCFGNSFQIDADRIHHDLHKFREEFGPLFKLKLYGTNIVNLSSASLLYEAFETTPTDEIANDRSANSTSDIFYGRKHMGCANLSNITLLLREFHKSAIPRYFEREQFFELLNKEEIKRLHLNLISKPTCNINPHEYLRTYFKNVCAILLIGERLSETVPDTDAPWEFIDLLFELIEPSVDGALRTFPFLRHLPGYYGDVYRRTVESRDKVAKRFFEDQKKSYISGRMRGLVDVCLMRQSDDVIKTGSTLLSDEHIKGFIFDTLAAGMTELLKSIRLFILLMCHYQDIQTRLQAEIDNVIGTERFPEVSDRKWMPFTNAVMLELLRYGSQTPLAIPHLCKKGFLLDGYYIENGSVIFPNLYSIHHDSEIWGDPWDFRPERFLDNKGDLLPPDHSYIRNVVPFSLGKRACPGQDFARSRIFITITSLLQRVRILPPENYDLPSADPRLYTRKYPMAEPQYKCRIISRENIIL